MDKGAFFPLAQNAALLIALVYLYDMVPKQQRRRHFQLWRLLVGLVIGLVGVIIMMTPLELQPGLFFDARSVLFSVSGLFFGGVPTLIAAIICSIYRYSLGGETVWISIALIFLAGGVGVLWRAKRKSSLAEIGYQELYSFGMLIHLGMLALMIFLPMGLSQQTVVNLALPLLAVFPIATMLIGGLLSKHLEIERDEQIRLQDTLLFQGQFNVGNIGIAISSVDKRWIRVNPYVCQMLKYTEQELINSNWIKLTHPDDVSADIEHYERMLAGEIDSYELDKRYLAKDGGVVYVHLTVACKRVAGKVELVVAGLLDITSLKQAEQEMRDNQEQLGLVLESSDLGLWDWNIVQDKVVRNERCAQLLGCDYPELIENEQLWVDAILPSDRQGLEKRIRRHLSGQTSHYKAEYRIQSRSGEIRWIADTGRVVSRDDNGQALRMCGVHSDITDAKRVQESMRLAASVYNNSSEAMTVMDQKGHIITVNQAFSEITGYSYDTVIKQHIGIIRSRRNGSGFYKKLFETLQSEHRWQGEVWLKSADNQEYIVWLTVNAIEDEDGNVNRWVALFSDITDKKNTEQMIWRQANYDALTGLPNRRMFLEYLEHEISLANGRHQHFALLFLDLDYFKEVNDTLGHDIGDQLLIETAERLKRCIRESDVVARLGGDEFIIVLPGIVDNHGVERVAEQILTNLAEPYQLGDETSYISASIGITLYPDDANSPETLLKNADQAMYAAKDLGRNRFNYFTPSMQESARYRMELIRDLRNALKNQEFNVFYQPIVDLTTEQVFKAEALIRWHHPSRGNISPAEFIPVAEDTGMIIDIGTWVFEQSARQAVAWREEYGKAIQISVNKSPVQFRDEGEEFERWIELLKELNLAKSGICIEITEGLLLDTSIGVSEKLLQYRDAGVQVSLDDFGTGYSSLAYLKKFDIDYLKIDQSFTRNLGIDDNDLVLCEAIIVMAHKLGMKVIAEGVETQEQRDILAAAGCDYAQGYYYSPPVTHEEFAKQFLRPSQDLLQG